MESKSMCWLLFTTILFFSRTVVSRGIENRTYASTIDQKVNNLQTSNEMAPWQSLQPITIYKSPPQLTLGPALNPDNLKEGDDVYFVCGLKANSQGSKVVWKHNGKIMPVKFTSGMIVSGKYLVLQKISKGQSGNYTCVATNVEGDLESNIVFLKIMYRPICSPDQKRIYEVAKQENSEVLCNVESYPPPDSFKWYFSNSTQLIDVPQTQYRSENCSSRLTYTPKMALDYGTVMCWASNLVGKQKEPCIFHIKTPDKPVLPFNRSVVNQTP